MCGIVGAVAERNVVPILMEGLRRLEYRGYDSAGVAVVDPMDTHETATSTRSPVVGSVGSEIMRQVSVPKRQST